MMDDLNRGFYLLYQVSVEKGGETGKAFIICVYVYWFDLFLFDLKTFFRRKD
jgi:hypothetical protein